MIESMSIEVPGSLVCICDADSRSVTFPISPADVDERPVLYTDTSVIVQTQHAIDGPTSLTLIVNQLPQGVEKLTFTHDSNLRLATGVLRVSLVDNTTLGRYQLSRRVRVRVWHNTPVQGDVVVVCAEDFISWPERVWRLICGYWGNVVRKD